MVWGTFGAFGDQPICVTIQRVRRRTRTMFGKVRACISDLDKLEKDVRSGISSQNLCGGHTPVPLSTTRGTLVSMMLCQSAEE